MKQSCLLVIFTVSLLGCASKTNSRFFENCTCQKVDLVDGIQITDAMNHFMLTFPDSSWQPTENFDQNGNGLGGGKLFGDSWRFVGVTELLKVKPWPDKETQQKDIEAQFDVVESGRVFIDGNECLWNLVKIDDEFISNTLYITIERPSENRFYTFNISVQGDQNIKKRLCEMESFIGHFEIKKKK